MKILIGLDLARHTRQHGPQRPASGSRNSAAPLFYLPRRRREPWSLASPEGRGQPPIDPVQRHSEGQTDSTRRFKADPAGPGRCSRATSRLADVSGGRPRRGSSNPRRPTARCGTWPKNPHSIALIEAFYKRRGSRSPPSATRPACSTASRSRGQPLVKGKRGDGLHQRRGGGGPPHQGRAVPRGG